MIPTEEVRLRVEGFPVQVFSDEPGDQRRLLEAHFPTIGVELICLRPRQQHLHPDQISHVREKPYLTQCWIVVQKSTHMRNGAHHNVGFD